ncbi:MAG: hypothetical protein ACOY3N_09515 [Bradyrhizobium sp.]|uniref:hypothetical protein n=1 Tax=Bradyrhizobium sp. TaxID=376 RepID=UPI003BF3E8AA
MLQRTPSRLITVSNLIDADTGKLNRDVYVALVHREALRTFGSLAPRYIREASKYYRSHVADQVLAWRQARGLPVATSMVAPFAGGFGSAF